MNDYVKAGIEIFFFLSGLLGVYYKVKYEVKKNTTDISSLDDRITEHCKETTICNKRFENLTLDIAKLQTEENMKTEYQTQIVEKILQPVLKSMNDSMRDYVDVKTGVISKEIEALKLDNMQFKSEVKSIIQELKEENSKSIDRIIDVLKKK